MRHILQVLYDLTYEIRKIYQFRFTKLHVSCVLKILRQVLRHDASLHLLKIILQLVHIYRGIILARRLVFFSF